MANQDSPVFPPYIIKGPQEIKLQGLNAAQISDKFLLTEEDYVNGLRVCDELHKRLRKMIEFDKQVFPEKEIQQLFTSLPMIYNFNKLLYSDLLKLRLEKNLVDYIGKKLLEFIPHLKIYIDYIQNYKDGLQFLFQKKMKSQKVRDFVELEESVLGHCLESYFLLPVTRLPHYLAFTVEIHNKLKKDKGGSDLHKAIVAIQKVTDEMSNKLRDISARRLVVNMQEKLFKNNLALVSPQRYVVKSGYLKKVFAKRGIHLSAATKYLFILFNDILLYATKSGKTAKLHHVLCLPGMQIEEVPDQKKIKNCFRIISAGLAKEISVYAPKPADKQEWMAQLQRTIDLASLNSQTLHGYGPDDDLIVERRIRKKDDTAVVAGQHKDGASEPEQYEEERMERPQLVPENQQTNCDGCGKVFSGLKRKLHCKYCGFLFCSGCALYEIDLPNLGYKSSQRVCNNCFLRIRKIRNPNMKDTNPKWKLHEQHRTSCGEASSQDYRVYSGASIHGGIGGGHHGANSGQEWVELKDPQSGYPYYENLKTGVTQWEKPKDFKRPSTRKAPPPPPKPDHKSRASPKKHRSKSPVRQSHHTVASQSPYPTQPNTEVPPCAPPCPPPPPGTVTASADSPYLRDADGKWVDPSDPAGAGVAPKSMETATNQREMEEALKESLERYRKFVQTDETDMDMEDTGDWDDEA